MSKSERTIVLINKPGAGKNTEFDLTDIEEAVLTQLREEVDGTEKVICAFLHRIKKVKEFTFSTVEDAMTAMRLYANDGTSIVYREIELEACYPQLDEILIKEIEPNTRDEDDVWSEIAASITLRLQAL